MRKAALLWTLLFLVGSSMFVGGCKKDRNDDVVVTPAAPERDWRGDAQRAIDAARNAMSDPMLERCAPEELATARATLARAEEAFSAERYEEAINLAREAQRQAGEARQVAMRNPECNPPAERSYQFSTVYFEFDSSSLRDDTRRTLEAHARELNRDTNVRVRVEGHCSEEGTNEYNMALGERRARAVRDFLVRMGVDRNRIDIISYGEERPVGTGAVNRRAEFVVR